MLSVKNELIRSKRITQEDAQYFFGYYDTPAWSGSDRYHLCHKVDFCHRLPRAEDKAELGYIDLEDNTFYQVAHTTAWNFQQGSMLQWHPANPESDIIYNSRKDDLYRGIVHNIHTGARRYLDRPVANVDPTGAYAVSISFERMFDFRPGYGYAGWPDPYNAVNHPDKDGIFLIDMSSGRSRMVLSLQQIWDFSKSRFPGEDKKLLVNHITFNPDGTRLVFLVRYFPENGEPWKTAIMTANRDGSGLFLLSDYSYASHYHWRDKERIVFHSHGSEAGAAGDQLYVLKDRTKEAEIIDARFFLRDGHCSYSPDRRHLLYDSYPDAQGYRHLYVYHLEEKSGITLGSYFSDPQMEGDIRCDLHPRWNRQGTHISFDSSHEGRRHMYTMDLRTVL